MVLDGVYIKNNGKIAKSVPVTGRPPRAYKPSWWSKKK